MLIIHSHSNTNWRIFPNKRYFASFYIISESVEIMLVYHKSFNCIMRSDPIVLYHTVEVYMLQ